MERKLIIWQKKDENSSVPFLSDNKLTPVRIIDFTYTASRMSIPSLEAEFMYPICLDDYWTYREYVEFNGEKYWVSAKPSSQKNNTDARYKHSIKFYPERRILSDVYFYDIVNKAEQSDKGNRYCSYSSEVTFFGTIIEFAERIKKNFIALGIDYDISVDTSQLSDEQLNNVQEFTCSDTYILDALTAAYELWNIPFYFVGKKIVFGYYSDAIDTYELCYRKQLLSISKDSLNSKIVTRATGVGSSENIPFYYPNESEKGNLTLFFYDGGGNRIFPNIIDHNTFATSIITNKKTDSEIVKYVYTIEEHITTISIIKREWAYLHPADANDIVYMPFDNGSTRQNIQAKWYGEETDDQNEQWGFIKLTFKVDNAYTKARITCDFSSENGQRFTMADFRSIRLEREYTEKDFDADGNEIDVSKVEIMQTWYNTNKDWLDFEFKDKESTYVLYFDYIDIGKYLKLVESNYDVFIEPHVDTLFEKYTTRYWIAVGADGSAITDAKRHKNLRSIGVAYDEDDTQRDAWFYVLTDEVIPYQTNLMPSIFAEGIAFGGNVKSDSKGIERFYNAQNGIYNIGGEALVFENEYKEYNRNEYKYNFDYIKPTIEGVTNADGDVISEIIGIAYDDDDNDTTLGDNANNSQNANSYEHKYFYVKLRKLGFNLFDYATETDAMTLQIRSGNLNGCKFKVQAVEVSENSFRNPVQVDADGNIVSGNYDKKIDTNRLQAKQQDTTNNEVWIALLKDDSTFGIIMPNVENNYKMDIGDSFNIINIKLPLEYIKNAQKRLDDAIVTAMSEDNYEKFSYSIDLSRIYIGNGLYNKTDADALDFLSRLSESVKIMISYNGNTIEQFVSSYTYQSKGNDVLPQISIELEESITQKESLTTSLRKIKDATTKKKISSVVRSVNDDADYANNKTLKNKANKSNTLGGYGIEDAFIDDDGNITLGDKTISVKKGDVVSIDWSQISNKPEDLFEKDANGDIKVKNGKGLYSDSFISAKGKNAETSGGSGLDTVGLWEALRAKATSDKEIIDDSHLSKNVLFVDSLKWREVKE